MTTKLLDKTELLALMPHQRPFRFVDQIIYIDEREALTHYTFREDEYFYTGHFPQDPLTPGVILLEAMSQGSAVLQGLYALSQTTEHTKLTNYKFMLTRTEADFFASVSPGESITMRSTVLAWRRNLIRCRVEAMNSGKHTVAVATISAMAVERGGHADNVI
jgi:3-hydroxyacyl-[acyl-carrier-protein] dehydratase